MRLLFCVLLVLPLLGCPPPGGNATVRSAHVAWTEIPDP